MNPGNDPKYTPLEFQNLIEQDFKSISVYPLFSVDIEGDAAQVYLIDSIAIANKVLRKIRERAGTCYKNMPMIGIDTETKVWRKEVTAFVHSANHTVSSIELKRAPSLVQLCISQNIILCFSIYRMCHKRKSEGDGEEKKDVHYWYPDHVPSLLKEIIGSQQVLKVGVAAQNDAVELERFYGISAKSVLDLSTLAVAMRLPKHSLAALVYMYIGHTVNKSKKLVFSDWDAPRIHFEKEALIYAAKDAYYSMQLFEKMVAKPSNIPSNFPNFKNDI